MRGHRCRRRHARRSARVAARRVARPRAAAAPRAVEPQPAASPPTAASRARRTGSARCAGCSSRRRIRRAGRCTSARRSSSCATSTRRSTSGSSGSRASRSAPRLPARRPVPHRARSPGRHARSFPGNVMQPLRGGGDGRRTTTIAATSRTEPCPVQRTPRRTGSGARRPSGEAEVVDGDVVQEIERDAARRGRGSVAGAAKRAVRRARAAAGADVRRRGPAGSRTANQPATEAKARSESRPAEAGSGAAPPKPRRRQDRGAASRARTPVAQSARATRPQDVVTENCP